MCAAALRIRRYLSRCALIGALAVAHSLTAADTAWAKGKKESPPAPATKSYVLPYAVVTLGVALGLIVVLRPVKRDNEPKRQDKGE